MRAKLFHNTSCQLGEGPLWVNNTLYFFDIEGNRLHALDEKAANHRSWDMGCYASAAGRLESGKLLIATEHALQIFDPEAGNSEHLIDLETDNTDTRSNDGRADRQGGFWIGTMSTSGKDNAGAIYRFYKGEVRKLVPNVSIPNAISFAPDGQTAYFTDTTKQMVSRWGLDPQGWPVGDPTPFYKPVNGAPDGAVVDSEGALILALWGGSRAIRVTHDGAVTHEFETDASNVTCPAFGPDGRLYFTTAKAGLTDIEVAEQPSAGGIFVIDAPAPGQEEPIVQL